MNKKIKIAVLYPFDPVGKVIGGTESFVRGLIKAAPDHIEYNIFGATSDPKNRPVGKWSKCRLGNKSYNYFPLCELANTTKRTRMPATFTHMFNAELKLPDLAAFDIIESHRIEHFISARSSDKPWNLFLHHTAMEIVRNKSSDVRWKWMPGLYLWLEGKIINRIGSLFIVREDGARLYREKYPLKKELIEFVATSFDADLFYPITPEIKKINRSALLGQYGVSDNEIIITFVGRLDSSKDPELLLASFIELLSKRNNASLMLIGDGILMHHLNKIVEDSGLGEKVLFLGFKSAAEVASLMQVSDIFALTSAYEGMPIALSEAMGCGLPVVTTDVGEVRKLVKPGINGEICESRSPVDFAKHLNTVCDKLALYSGTPCIESARPYTPELVFKKVYKKYEQLAGYNPV